MCIEDDLFELAVGYSRRVVMHRMAANGVVTMMSGGGRGVDLSMVIASHVSMAETAEEAVIALALLAMAPRAVAVVGL